MSATDLSTPPPSPSAPPTGPDRAAARGRRRGDLGPGGPGLRRSCSARPPCRRRQARRIEDDARTRAARARRSTSPRSRCTLGPWKGKDTELDPLIARATGADQIVTRRYVNQDTGATIDVILLYGPAVEMYIHAPEVCYPAAGYAQVAGPDVRAIKSGAGVGARSGRWSTPRARGAPGELQEVYYSWWYDGRWSPDVGKQKHFERIPSMYKVHLARRVTAGREARRGQPLRVVPPRAPARDGPPDGGHASRPRPEARGELLSPGKAGHP